jgi:hypothetical protein
MSLDLFIRPNIFLNDSFSRGSAPSNEIKSKLAIQIRGVILDEVKSRAEQTGDISKLEILSAMHRRTILTPAIGDFLDRLFLLEPVDKHGFINSNEQNLVDELVKAKLIPALTNTYKDFSFQGNNFAREYLFRSIKENNLTEDIRKFYDDALSDFRVVINKYGDYDSATTDAEIILLKIIRESVDDQSDRAQELDNQINELQETRANLLADNEGYVSIRKLGSREAEETNVNEIETPMNVTERMLKNFPKANFRFFDLADMKLMFDLGILKDGLNVNSSWKDFDSLESKALRNFCRYLRAFNLEEIDLEYHASQEQRIRDLGEVLSKIDTSGLSERANLLADLANVSKLIIEEVKADRLIKTVELISLLNTIKVKLELTQDDFYSHFKGDIEAISKFLKNLTIVFS